MPRDTSTRQLAERFRQTKAEPATSSPSPAAAAQPRPAVSKFTLKFGLEEAAAFDEWLALRARRELGRRVEKREVVLALLDELYRNPGLERRILDRLTHPKTARRLSGGTAGSGVSTVGTGARAGGTGARTVACSGPPADYRDDELELADDDPELDCFDDLCDRDED